jgi:hypothetical protein
VGRETFFGISRERLHISALALPWHLSLYPSNRTISGSS